MYRFKSILNSVLRNGIFSTCSILIQILFVKVGLKENIQLGANKYFLRKKNSDIPVFKQIFMDGEYDIHINFEPKIIIDLGANIGLATAFFNNRFPKSRIIALEPDKNNFNQLLKNISSDKIKALNLAIWSKNEDLQLIKNKKHNDWGIQVKSISDVNYQSSVKGITMEELISLEKIKSIDILKIDIEGAEEELFKGDIHWLEIVKVLIIELHDSFIPASSNNFFVAISKLKKFDFYMHGENIIIKNRSFE